MQVILRENAAARPIRPSRYRGRLSGPLCDRFDLVIPANAIPAAELMSTSDAESSHEIRRRVERARARQADRYGMSGIATNADIQIAELRQYY